MLFLSVCKSTLSCCVEFIWEPNIYTIPNLSDWTEISDQIEFIQYGPTVGLSLTDSVHQVEICFLNLSNKISELNSLYLSNLPNLKVLDLEDNPVADIQRDLFWNLPEVRSE